MNKLNYSNIKIFKKLAKYLNRMLVRCSILGTAKIKNNHVLTEHQRIQPTELKSSHKMGEKNVQVMYLVGN